MMLIMIYPPRPLASGRVDEAMSCLEPSNLRSQRGGEPSPSPPCRHRAGRLLADQSNLNPPRSPLAPSTAIEKNQVHAMDLNLDSLGCHEALGSIEAQGPKRPKGPLRSRRLRDPAHGAPMVPTPGSHGTPHGIPWHPEMLFTNT